MSGLEREGNWQGVLARPSLLPRCGPGALLALSSAQGQPAHQAPRWWGMQADAAKVPQTASSISQALHVSPDG